MQETISAQTVPDAFFDFDLCLIGRINKRSLFYGIFYILYTCFVISVLLKRFIRFVLELYSALIMLQNWNIVLWLCLWPLKYIKYRIGLSFSLSKKGTTCKACSDVCNITLPAVREHSGCKKLLFLHFYYAYLDLFFMQHRFAIGCAVRS